MWYRIGVQNLETTEKYKEENKNDLDVITINISSIFPSFFTFIHII